ncbi:MAG TPA: AraC family transcriptional regulator ligand-binding domain-containing protein [Fluviicoccus sp.]|nr:AraC family transcriptional regulator ligand-binding domain-containing protein [Fluviicoccus sp.]
MNPSRKELRFPKTTLEPIRHVLDNSDWGIGFDEVLQHLGISRQHYDEATFSLDGDTLLALHVWVKERTLKQIRLKDWLGYYSATSAGFAGLAALSAFTARDALAVAIRYMPLYAPAIRASLIEGPVTSRLELELIADMGRMNRFLLELTAGIVNIISRETMPEGIPRTIHFRHDAGVDANGRPRLEEYREAFECEVEFNSSFNGLVSQSRYLDMKTRRPNEATHLLANSILDSEMQARMASQSFASFVGGELMLLANEGKFPSLEDFADLIHVSPRTLNRKLAREETSFKELANEAWFRLARELLANRKIPIANVAERSGFTSRHAFSRAFKTMSGETPQQWRDMQAEPGRRVL